MVFSKHHAVGARRRSTAANAAIHRTLERAALNERRIEREMDEFEATGRRMERKVDRWRLKSRGSPGS